MAMMRIAGKGTDDTAKGIRTNNSGNLITTKEWTPEMLVNQATATFEVGETATKQLLGIAEIGKAGITSLRIANSTGVPVEIMFYADRNNADVSILYDLEGNRVSFTVPAQSSLYIVTPEDMPILNYIDWLNLRVTPKEAVSSSDNPRVRVSVLMRS